MSARTSRKSELSPSVTRGSNAIDLGKNSGVDMGRKSQPSITSGGIGVTTEVADIGGLKVTGGVSVDISPIDLAVNYDPAENTVSVASGAEIPGGFLGVSGGVRIDIDTGEVVGGAIGGEVVGLGVNVSNSKDGGLGIEFTVQIPFTPIEFSVGFGYSPPKQAIPSPSPSPSPAETPTPTPIIAAQCQKDGKLLYGTLKRTVEGGWKGLNSDGSIKKTYQHEYTYTPLPNGKFLRKYTYTNFRTGTSNPPGQIEVTLNLWRAKPDDSRFAQEIPEPMFPDTVYNGAGASTYFETFGGTENQVICLPNPNSPPPPPSPSPSPSPFPNPPPRKRNMDECCRESIKLQRLIVRHLGAERSSGQEILPDGVKEVGSAQDGIRQAYPFVVKKKWVEPNTKENEGISILNDRQLALVLGGMLERLERVLGTAEFYKDSDKKLRQSEGNMLSWLTGKNKDFRYPDPNDFWLNSDDGIINEKLLEVRSIADGLRYQIEALNRLERILPIAERCTIAVCYR